MNFNLTKMNGLNAEADAFVPSNYEAESKMFDKLEDIFVKHNDWIFNDYQNERKRTFEMAFNNEFTNRKIKSYANVVKNKNE